MTDHNEQLPFGLAKWEVRNMDEQVIWTGLSNGPIHALDQYIMSLDAGYGSYTTLPQEPGVEWVYTFNGEIWAICENTVISPRRVS